MNPGRAEASFWAAFLRNRNVDAGTALDGAIPVAGGYALYVTGTHIDLALGAGTTRALREDDLAVVEAFYAARERPARFELDETAIARDDALLRARGYVPEDLALAVFEGPTAAGPAPNGPIAVRTTTNRRGWSALAVSAYGDHETDPAALKRTYRLEAAAAQVLVVASLDGQDVGVAAFGMVAELALLCGAAVLPAFRGRGVHRALVAERLALAHARGATHASLKAAPGSAPERSATHFGFVRTGLRRRVRRDA